MLFTCNRHGTQGFQEMCSHLFEQVNNLRYPETFSLPVWDVKVCKECYENFELNKLEDLKEVHLHDLVEKSEKEASKIEKRAYPIYEKIDSVCHCVQCINEAKLHQARKDGHKDPFIAYEKTLIHEDGKEIEKLEKCLKSKFSFKKVWLEEIGIELNSCYIFAGAITYPLQIKIHHIEDKATQDEILSTISAFFEKKHLTQRIVSFYKEYVFIRDETHFKRGEDLLLRKEEYL